MARVNISLPDDLYEQARRSGLNVSRVAAGAIAVELDRRAKGQALADYLKQLDAELGPVPAADARAASEWASRLDAADDKRG